MQTRRQTLHAISNLNTHREAGAIQAITQADSAMQVNLCGIEEHHAVVNPLLGRVPQIHMPIIQWAPAGRAN